MDSKKIVTTTPMQLHVDPITTTHVRIGKILFKFDTILYAEKRGDCWAVFVSWRSSDIPIILDGEEAEDFGIFMATHWPKSSMPKELLPSL